MKPTGLSLSLDGRTGLPRMTVHAPTRTEDKVWEAVRTAIEEGWDPTRFISEARQAWREELQEAVKRADSAFAAAERVR